MKHLLNSLMAVLLVCGLILPVWAETQPPETQSPPAVIPTEVPVTEAPMEETQQPTAPPSVETKPETPTEEGNPQPPETTGPSAAPETCAHSWVYVEVEPTCAEYGAKGYVCAYCEALADVVAINPVAHSYDHTCDDTCNLCGGVRSVTHTFSSAWSRNSTQHWHACNVCGEKSDVGSHYPGPAATEERAQYCLTCGLMMMPQKAHTHVYAAEYSSDAREHWYACEGCNNRKSVEAHSYDDPCDPDCNICGHTTEKNHENDGWQSDEKEHWSVCSLCGETTAPERHVPAPELRENGAQLCEVCDFEISAGTDHVHEALGDWNNDENGHWILCSCGEKLEEDSHHWDFSKEIQEETMIHTCTVCGAERTDSVPEAESGLPWWFPVIIAALLCGAAALAVLMLLGKKKGIF